MKKRFGDLGKTCVSIIPDTFANKDYCRGSFTNNDPKIRRQAIDYSKQMCDVAMEMDCEVMNFWLGQDGYDYSFQADYTEAWKYLCDGLAECSQHNKQTRILVEYKPNEPRKYCFVSTTAKVLLLLQQLDQVGVLMDVGHALQGRENIAEAAALLHQYGK